MGVREDIIAIPDERLRNGNLSADYLVFMDILDSPQRWWTGWGMLRIGGFEWKGIGDVINISDLPASYKPSAEKVTFTISAASKEMMQISQEGATRVYGRDVIVYQQFFDVDPVDASAQPWSPLGSPFVQYSGTMNQMTYKSSRNNDGDVSRFIELTSDGIFTNRNAPPNGRWSDRDQQRRFPGDKGCDRMHIYTNHTPTWTV